jgi:predicted O-methyltransferase YrrM
VDGREAEIAKAFNRDTNLANRVVWFIKRWRLKVAVETGTYTGDTTIWLAKHFDAVHTLELNADYQKAARERCEREATNIFWYLGDSAELLPRVLQSLHVPAFFFLDAHWGDRWPLVGELKALKRWGGAAGSVILIHDCKVPGTDLGYDVYGGQELTLEYLAPHLTDIFGEWRHEYHTDAVGARRGAVFVERGEGVST